MNTYNTYYSNKDGGWRDTLLRKNLNDESTGTIWNAIQSTDFKNNITPVLKITSNAYANNNNEYFYCYSDYNNTTSNSSSTTVDKLWILSPSEMGMPIIRDYKPISHHYGNCDDLYNYTNVHYYDSNSYMNAIKSSSANNSTGWLTEGNYIYFGNTYQWWMLPAGNRTDNITDGRTSEQQAYHNTDSYSYCTLTTSSNPSTNNNKKCSDNNSYTDWYWLRSTSYNNIEFAVFIGNSFDSLIGDLDESYPHYDYGVVIAFSF